MLLTKEMTKSDIEKCLQGAGDFVQIDMMLRLLKEPSLASDTKKFVYIKLAGIYEKKKMFFDASKMYDSAAIYCLDNKEKSNYFIQEGGALIKGGFFDHVDKALQKAFMSSNASEKQAIYNIVKDFYKKSAESYEAELKKSNAVRVYEKMLELKLTEDEKKEIKEKLIALYEKLGKKKEFMIAGQGGERRKNPWMN